MEQQRNPDLDPAERDEPFEYSLRPQRLPEYIGQEKVKARLEIALQAAKGRKGKALTLKYLVSDNLSPQATGVTLTVKNAKHKVVKSFSLGTRNVATWYAVKWTPKAKGTYSYSVSAKDPGNPQVKAGSGKITVK